MTNSGSSSRKEKCFSLWLGIAAAECPPNHYRLLDLPIFEDSAELIRAAVHRRLAQIAVYNSADDVADAAALRKYISKVSTGLLNPKQKRIYDEELRTRLSTPIIHDPHSAPAPHDIDVANDGQRPQRLTTGVDGSRGSGTANTPVEFPADAPVAAPPNASIPVPTMESPQLTPTGKGSVWPWVAGIASLNTVALAGITVALLWHQSPPATVPNHVAAEPRRDRTPVAEPSAPAATIVPTALPQVPKPDVLPEIASPSERPAKTKKAETARQDSKSDSKVATDDSEKSEPSKDNLPTPKKKKKKKSANPFEEVVEEFTLPDLPSGIKTPSDPVSLGIIDPSKIDGVSLDLDAQAADLEARCALKLERQKIGDKLSRIWQILVSVKDSSDISLGRFQIDPNGNLAFGWRLSESYPKAGQLRNSVLVLQHGSLRKEVPLRTAINAPCGTFDFSKGKIAIPLQIDDLPKDQLLTITFKQLKGIEKTDLLNTNTPLNRRDVVIDKLISEANRITVRGEFFKDPNDGGVSLVMFPRYFEGIKSPALTVKDFNASVRRLMGDIHDNASAYAFAIGRLPELRRLIEINIGQQKGLDVRDPGETQRLGQLKTSLTKMRNEERNLIATLRRHRNNLPKNYRALSDLMSAGQLASDLQTKGQLEFEVISRSDARDIVLLRANGKPPERVVQRAFEIPPNPSMEGPWINFDEEALCDLNASGSFQVRSLINPVATQGGTWRQHDDDVELSNGRRSLQYKAIHNIELRNDTSGSLFRFF